MIDQEYKVLIGGQDFSDIISMEEGMMWTLQSYSSATATGQDTKGRMTVPILGERVQLAIKCPAYITKGRLASLVNALKMGSKGQREINVTYNDVAFGQGTYKFYCTNIPWIKSKLPEYPYHYGKEVTFQLTSTEFVRKQVANDAPKLAPIFNTDPEYSFKINDKQFNDIVDIDGFKGQGVEQSLSSQTGLTLDGKFHIPIIGSRTQNEIVGVEYVEVGRFRQLAKELGFGKTGERSHTVSMVDMVYGAVNQRFYCTEISCERVKLPNYPYHYVKGVKFQQAMKQFY